MRPLQTSKENLTSKVGQENNYLDKWRSVCVCGESFWSIGCWDCLIFILNFPSGLGAFACCLDWDQIPLAWNSSFLCALQTFLVLLARTEHAVNVLLNPIPLNTSSGPENIPHCLVAAGHICTHGDSQSNLSAIHLVCFLFCYFDPQNLNHIFLCIVLLI